MDDSDAIERQIDRLEAKALLHGRTEAIAAEIEALTAKLQAMDEGVGEDWLRQRDQELGRALGPLKM